MCYPVLTAITLQLEAISSLETTLSSVHHAFAGRRHSRLSRHHRVKPGHELGASHPHRGAYASYGKGGPRPRVAIPGGLRRCALEVDQSYR
jgi:hypothetical protein